jgi:hypothetical protein
MVSTSQLCLFSSRPSPTSCLPLRTMWGVSTCSDDPTTRAWGCWRSRTYRDGHLSGQTHLLNHKVGKVWNDGHWLTLDLKNVSSEELFGSSVYHISYQRACGRIIKWREDEKLVQLSERARGLCNTDLSLENDPQNYTNSSRRVLGFTPGER